MFDPPNNFRQKLKRHRRSGFEFLKAILGTRLKLFDQRLTYALWATSQIVRLVLVLGPKDSDLPESGFELKPTSKKVLKASYTSWNTMVQTLKAVRGGGGSVKIGTTGTISALMSREIESTKSANKVPSLCTSASDTTPIKPKPRRSRDGASGGSRSIFKNHECPETARKTKHCPGRTHQIPMLAADNISIDGTPIRQKPIKRGPSVVEIVDIKCGNADKIRGNPITSRLKKLGFSKLSESII